MSNKDHKEFEENIKNDVLEKFLIKYFNDFSLNLKFLEVKKS